MRILVKLECSHITIVNPVRIYQPWMCPACNEMKKTVDIITDEIHVRCQVMMGKKRCTFSRWVGLSSITGNEVANRHASMCNHHTVTVQKETNPEAVRIRAKLVERGLLA